MRAVCGNVNKRGTEISQQVYLRNPAIKGRKESESGQTGNAGRKWYRKLVFKITEWPSYKQSA